MVDPDLTADEKVDIFNYMRERLYLPVDQKLARTQRIGIHVGIWSWILVTIAPVASPGVLVVISSALFQSFWRGIGSYTMLAMLILVVMGTDLAMVAAPSAGAPPVANPARFEDLSPETLSDGDAYLLRSLRKDIEVGDILGPFHVDA